MSDPVPASTRTIWIVAAAVFAIAFLVTAFSGSIFMALLCLIAAGACGYQSRRAPRHDGAHQRDDGDEADGGAD